MLWGSSQKGEYPMPPDDARQIIQLIQYIAREIQKKGRRQKQSRDLSGNKPFHPLNHLLVAIEFTHHFICGRIPLIEKERAACADGGFCSAIEQMTKEIYFLQSQ